MLGLSFGDETNVVVLTVANPMPRFEVQTTSALAVLVLLFAQYLQQWRKADAAGLAEAAVLWLLVRHYVVVWTCAVSCDCTAAAADYVVVAVENPK